MSHISGRIFFTINKKRQINNDDELSERGSKNPRMETDNDDSAMMIDNDQNKKRQSNNDDDELSEKESKNPRMETDNDDSAMMIDNDQTTAFSDNNHDSNDHQEVSRKLNKMSINNNSKTILMKSDKSDKLDKSDKSDNRNDKPEINVTSMIKDVLCIGQKFDDFTPLIKTFFGLGAEIISLYEKAEHHKELCSLLLQRCNCAVAAVQDLWIRKSENKKFFCRQENLNLFKDFIKCIKKIRNFIEEISQLGKLQKFLCANSIEETFSKLTTEFDGCMNSLNFTFTLQAFDNFAIIKNETREIRELLLNVYGVSDDKQSQQNFLKDMDSLAERNKEFQRQCNQNKVLDSSEFKILEENEPLLNGSEYQKTKICPSKRIEKRILSSSTSDCEEFCFKEFPNNTTTFSDESQIEIRKQVNILKELKNTKNIIRFFGVAKENSRYYLVTEWMEYGNLYEYYTNHKDKMSWETKVNFALDICCGISYLNDCKILHHDIQSANMLVDKNDKIKIANFGLSKKFHDLTRNITPNIENVRYMAPEKLDNDMKKEKVPYDSKCEIYSVGALLWEIAELKKPHSDLNKSEILIGIRKRVNEGYCLQFSDGIPHKWKDLVKDAMLYEPECRPRISEICRNLHKLKEHSKFSMMDECSDDEGNSPIDEDQNTMASFFTITILTVEDAIRAHKSKNGNKQLAWQSFKYHSVTDIFAKYMVGYYYYHEEVPEIKKISKDERVRIAVEIFKETADKGNPSAQLRYGICLWQGEGINSNSLEALRYLKMAAIQGNSAAMYVIGKAYLNGGNGIEQDKEKGSEYLKQAALKNHQKAKDLCVENNIVF